MTTTAPSLRSRLDALHSEYVERVNCAVADDRDDHVAALAADYDAAATRMVAESEGSTT